MKNRQIKSFTLIELLMVVAIIAVVGAGVAISMQRVDKSAKTAVTMNDIGVIKKTFKSFASVNDYNYPNGYDSLVLDGTSNIYSGENASDKTGVGHTISSYITIAEADKYCVMNLAQIGVNEIYNHKVGSDADNACDPNFSTDKSDVVVIAQAKTETTPGAGDGVPATALAFIDPDKMGKGGRPNSLLSWLKINPDDVAKPSVDAATNLTDKRKYWLVVFGIGARCSIYDDGNIKMDSPVQGKRYADNEEMYNRYLAVYKVPCKFSHGSSVEYGTLVDVLSPVGYTQEKLNAAFKAEKKGSND